MTAPVDDIRLLQRRLSIGETGVFGPLTLAAVNAALDLMEPDTETGFDEPGDPPLAPLPPLAPNAPLPPGRLSENFSLAELVHSNTAVAQGISNVPSAVSVANLQVLVDNVLQPLRTRLGRAVRVTSGYRNAATNRAVGGAAGSQHLIGEAADIQVPGMNPFDVAETIRQHFRFDQLILTAQVRGTPSSGFVHVSFREGRLRGDLLTQFRGTSGYQRGIIRP
jgi:zinc D-Ala-D-Ala carboxypeptidase